MKVKKYFSHFFSSYSKKLFGVLPSGKKIFSYTLKNSKGVKVQVINYGATIISLEVPVSRNKCVDVALGFDNLEHYINSFSLPNAPYFGAIVGRYAGRINKASFRLNEQKIEVTKNHGEHQIHGGVEGFSKVVWDVIEHAAGKNPFITLRYISKSNEENFPGELITEVTYTLTEENELNIAMKAKTDEDTVVNLTQHSYFNLDGHSESVVNQKLYVNATQVLEKNNHNIPTGHFFNLAATPYDFSVFKACPAIIDDTFVLHKVNQVAACLFSSKNNLKMSVYTNQPAVHIYVGGNCYNQIKGKENAHYHPQSGICFETQNFPDAPNHDHFPSAVLKKGDTYYHNTIFKFETYNYEKN